LSKNLRSVAQRREKIPISLELVECRTRRTPGVELVGDVLSMSLMELACRGGTDEELAERAKDLVVGCEENLASGLRTTEFACREWCGIGLALTARGQK